MRTYYINNGKENGGPFTLDELKTQQLTKATLVWYQGMAEWKHAHDIEELKSFFTVVPPPIKQAISTPEIELHKTSETILGLKKSHFFLALLFFAILLTVFILNVIQNNKRSELDLKNKQTEFSNEKITLEQNERNEERIQEEIRKRIALENNNLRKRDSINSRISEIKRVLIDKKNQLATLTKDLSDAEKFTFFRSESEKTEEISLIQNDIRSIKTEIIQLENESDGLYLQLDMIH
jgi:preprotein translocase subunit SecG